MFARAIIMIFILAFAPKVQAAVLSNGIKIGPEQQLMFQAAKYAMNGQWREAEYTYSQVIAINNRFIDAYLQRAVARRELGNNNAYKTDATMAVRLAEQEISRHPGNAKLYYQRGTGYRFLKNFKQARADISQAINLSGNNSWRADLQALALEEKAGDL